MRSGKLEHIGRGFLGTTNDRGQNLSSCLKRYIASCSDAVRIQKILGNQSRLCLKSTPESPNLAVACPVSSSSQLRHLLVQPYCLAPIP